MSTATSVSSSMRFTAQQKAALDVLNASVALSAGAGCGKTSVLTHRYVTLLEPPFSLGIHQIVALTFTEKAARELRDRVRRSCLDRLAASDDPEMWQRVVQGLESARISTFHAFCAQILREHADEAEVDSGFEILDESLATNLRQEALDVCLRRWLANQNPDFMALAIDYGLVAIEEALGKLLTSRPDIDLASWGSRSPEEVVAAWESRLRDHHLATLLHRLHQDHEPLLRVLREHSSTNARAKNDREFVLATLPQLAHMADPIATLVDLREHAKVQGRGSPKDWPSTEIYTIVKDHYESLRKAITEVLKIASPDEGRSLAAAHSGLAFARLGQEALDQFSAMKQVEGVLDFHDLQTRVRHLLRANPGGARDRLQASIAMLLVDEFQDTDPIQSEILESLAGPEPALGRLYLVGDVKQSIYRFRGAQPELFETFRNRFPREGRLNLSENFRSVPGILSFVNMLFARTFVGEEHVLHSGFGTATTPSPSQPCVNFLWVDSSQEAVSKRRGEADAIARLISRRLSEGWWIRDRNASEPRKATAGDVVMLFRSGSDFGLYEQALAREGLEYHLVDGSTYFSQQEVIDLINLVTTLEDPLDALALAGTLRSPIFGVSDEALFWLANVVPGDLPLSFDRWESVANSLSDRDRVAVSRAFAMLSRWRSLKDQVSISSLLDQCLTESGFEAALMGEFLGDRKRANVRKLVRLARRFDEKGGFTLSDFAMRLRADLRNPPREEQAATTDEAGDAVRLMTIHKAKGLEFPIVIVPDLDRQPPNSSPLVAYDEHLGVLVRANADDDDEHPSYSLGALLYKAQENQAEYAEALRCLYVATTRARDVLILSAGRDAQKKPRSPSMKLLAERFDLSTGRPVEDWPEGEAPRIEVIDADTLTASERPRRSRFRPALLQTARRILDATAPAKTNMQAPMWRSGRLDLARRPDRGGRIHRLLLNAIVARDMTADASPLERVRSVAGALGEWTSRSEIVSAASRLELFKESPFGRSLREGHEWVADREWQGRVAIDGSPGISYRSSLDLASRSADGSWRIAQIVMGNDDSSRSIALMVLSLAMEDQSRLGLEPVVAAYVVVIEDGKVQMEEVGRSTRESLLTSMWSLLNDG